MSSYRKAVLIVLPFVLLGVVGCGFVNVALSTADESVKKTFPTKTPPKVIVETFNGNIDVTTDPDPTVKAEVIKRASGSDDDEAEENLDYVEVTMTQDGTTIHISAKMTEHRFIGNYGAAVVLQVPANTVLDVKTSNGKINVAGPTKDVVAQSSNGGIQVKGAKGTVNLNTSNGSIQVNGGSGKLDLKTSNGSITVDSSRAEIDASTSNGSIQFSGELADGDHTFHSSNGRITLNLPSNAQFRIDAKTSNAPIKTDFDIDSSKGSSKRHLKGQVGDKPKASLKLHTSNGSIQILKKK